MKRFYMAEGKETPDGEYMLMTEHEEKLRQFERLRRYAYMTLAEANQVLWEIDGYANVEKKEASRIGIPDLNDEYDALVRDAMNWRSRPVGKISEPKPFDLPPGIEPRLKTLQDAARAVRIALKDFYPHGENAAAAIMAMIKESQS